MPDNDLLEHDGQAPDGIDGHGLAPVSPMPWLRVQVARQWDKKPVRIGWLLATGVWSVIAAVNVITGGWLFDAIGSRLPDTNSAPEIARVEARLFGKVIPPETVVGQGGLYLHVIATDKEGDEIEYDWQHPEAGTIAEDNFSSQFGPIVYFEPPPQVGTYDVTARVRDAHLDGFVTKVISVEVKPE